MHVYHGLYGSTAEMWMRSGDAETLDDISGVLPDSLMWAPVRWSVLFDLQRGCRAPPDARTKIH
jgi:hypothetical protein